MKTGAHFEESVSVAQVLEKLLLDHGRAFVVNGQHVVGDHALLVLAADAAVRTGMEQLAATEIFFVAPLQDFLHVLGYGAFLQ